MKRIRYIRYISGQRAYNFPSLIIGKLGGLPLASAPDFRWGSSSRDAVVMASDSRRIVLSVATMVCGVLVAAWTPAANAAGSVTHPSQGLAPRAGGGLGCDPNRKNNYLAGYFATAESGETGQAPDQVAGGVYASIYVYSPWVAGPRQGAPDTDPVGEYVMLAGTGKGSEWAQDGWIEFPGTKR